MVTPVVNDSAANMVSGIQKLGLHSLPCFVCTLKLKKVKKAVEENQVLSEVGSRARTVVFLQKQCKSQSESN